MSRRKAAKGKVYKMNNSKRFWETDASINQFKNKKRFDFFRSETYLHEKIKCKIGSILDVGCASGRLIELLNFYYKDFDFLGIDIVENQIMQAKRNYPSYKFSCCDIFSLDSLNKYELINATGVFQHETKYKRLLKFLWDRTSKYFLFDVKFLDYKKDLNNINKAFCNIDNNLVPFIILSPQVFFNYLRKLRNLQSVNIIAYETEKNSITTLPSNIKRMISAGILLEKKNSKTKLQNEFINYDQSLLVKKIEKVYHSILAHYNS